jgi:predicted methyltransferase
VRSDFPLVTLALHEALQSARAAGLARIEASIDLGRTIRTLEIASDHWSVGDARYPYLERCKDRTIHYWDGEGFDAAARFGDGGLIKLVPTHWGPPTFEIDGIKMLVTAQVSPMDDAARKVALVEPAGRTILDTCAGLGYFAQRCLAERAGHIVSYEKNPDVLWLRSLNPWSPPIDAPTLDLRRGDVSECIAGHAAASFDAVLHDPPRFGIAGELYSQRFYDELARVLRRGGRLFHYIGAPNRLTSGRDVPREVGVRLERAGFSIQRIGDGILARRK